MLSKGYILRVKEILYFLFRLLEHPVYQSPALMEEGHLVVLPLFEILVHLTVQCLENIDLEFVES